MKVYKTNAALGYNQYAYLIRLDKTQSGYNYVCIDTHNIGFDNDMYQLGKTIDDLEDFYVELCDNYELKDLSMYDVYKHIIVDNELQIKIDTYQEIIDYLLDDGNEYLASQLALKQLKLVEKLK